MYIKLFYYKRSIFSTFTASLLEAKFVFVKKIYDKSLFISVPNNEVQCKISQSGGKLDFIGWSGKSNALKHLCSFFNHFSSLLGLIPWRRNNRRQRHQRPLRLEMQRMNTSGFPIANVSILFHLFIGSTRLTQMHIDLFTVLF